MTVLGLAAKDFACNKGSSTIGWAALSLTPLHQCRNFVQKDPQEVTVEWFQRCIQLSIQCADMLEPDDAHQNILALVSELSIQLLQV